MNKLLYTLLLLLAFTQLNAAPQKISYKQRAELGEMMTRIVEREVVKARVRIQSLSVEKKRIRIHASRELSYYPFREDNIEALYDSVRMFFGGKYTKARVQIYTDSHEITELIPLAYRTKAPKKKKDQPIRFVNHSTQPLITRLSNISQPTKGLKNRHIALWQSHGRYFDQEQNRWRWQRVRLWETCEDLYTQSYVLPYLVPMLENAGACVLLPRERDVQTIELIADNDDELTYNEVGGWENGNIGFAHLREVYSTGDNPFRHGTTRRSYSITTGTQSTATWSADFPEKGAFHVYVSYDSSPHNVEDAHYTVHHAGGDTEFKVNQTMGGGTWICLGQFTFNEGEQAVVTLSNKSQKAGRIVSADAVKIGGGYGNISRITDAQFRQDSTLYTEETSGYPRFCEGARYWLQWAGFDPKVYAPKEHLNDYKEDLMSRALWVNSLMGGSQRLPDSLGLNIPIDMAFAFHSDAGVRDDNEIVGTLGIFYTRENKGRFEGGANRYRSRDLTDMVMTQIVSDIRRGFEPEWNRRGLWNRAYYEARIPAAPTMLLELLSHQNFADMRYGNDPRFKFWVSRAVYKGILRYLSSQYQVPYVVQPLPVEAFACELHGADSVRLSWRAVRDSLEATARPAGYILYTRKGNGGFDNGRYVQSNSICVAQEKGTIYSYKVTAMNEGGESFPSEILAAYHAPKSKGEVLIINGFDRVSAPYNIRQDTLAGFYHDIDGGVPDKYDISYVGSQCVFDLKMARSENEQFALGACHDNAETDVLAGNSFDYPYVHGTAIRGAGYSFCSASAKAVEQGRVSLDPYHNIDYILGKQRSCRMARGLRGYEFKTFSRTMQQALRSYVDKGGSLFVSGCYIGRDLWEARNATPEDRQFGKEVLHVSYDPDAKPSVNRLRITTPLRQFTRGEYTFQTKADKYRYGVEQCEALNPASEKEYVVMRYTDQGAAGAIASEQMGGTFVLAVPFETLPERQQKQLMNNVLRFFKDQQNINNK